jgi:hypothetical protein
MYAQGGGWQADEYSCGVDVRRRSDTVHLVLDVGDQHECCLLDVGGDGCCCEVMGCETGQSLVPLA